jgi:predicted nucleic acid-binding protein
VILVDAGPLVAIVDASDQHHQRCAAGLRLIREPLATVWPTIAEAMYLLLDLPKAQAAVWEMLERRVVRLVPLDEHDIPRIRGLMAKYADRPMDLADAALVRVAERDGFDAIFTVDDADFSVYRLNGRTRFRLVLGRLPPS